jgi:hypothetical protein
MRVQFAGQSVPPDPDEAETPIVGAPVDAAAPVAPSAQGPSAPPVVATAAAATDERPSRSVPGSVTPKRPAPQSGRRVALTLLAAIAAMLTIVLGSRFAVLGTALVASPPDGMAPIASSQPGPSSLAAPSGASSGVSSATSAGAWAPPVVAASASASTPSSAPPVLAPSARPSGSVAPSQTPAPRAPKPAVVTPPADAPAPKPAAPTSDDPTRDAQRALESGQTSAAVTLAKQATVADPSNTEAWLILGAAYEASGRPTLARAAYKSCVDRGSGDRVAECRALLAQ